MTVPFCVNPDNAAPIARKLVCEARSAVQEMSPSIARLHVGRGQYRLDAMSKEDLRTIRRLLTEMGAEIDGILEAQTPSLRLVAAE